MVDDVFEVAKNVGALVGVSAPSDSVSRFIQQGFSEIAAPAYALATAAYGSAPYGSTMSTRNYYKHWRGARKQFHDMIDYYAKEPRKVPLSVSPGGITSSQVKMNRSRGGGYRRGPPMQKRNASAQFRRDVNKLVADERKILRPARRGRSRTVSAKGLVKKKAFVPRVRGRGFKKGNFRQGRDFDQSEAPLAYNRNLRFRTSLNSRVGKGPLVPCNYHSWDEGVYAFYPNSGQTINCVVLGNSFADLSAEYAPTVWSTWYVPYAVYLAANSYQFFRVKSWSFHYVPFVNPNSSAGEIIFASTADVGVVENMGMTFHCTTGSRTNYNGHDCVTSDYLAVVDPSGGNLGKGTGHSIEIAIKTWTAGNVQQFQPYQSRRVYLNTPWSKWFRNQPPGGATYQTPVLFDVIDVPEIGYSVPGIAMIWGTMNDSFTAGSSDYFRKIGDLFVDAKLEFKLMSGTAAHTPDETKVLSARSMVRHFERHQLSIMKESSALKLYLGEVVSELLAPTQLDDEKDLVLVSKEHKKGELSPLVIPKNIKLSVKSHSAK